MISHVMLLLVLLYPRYSTFEYAGVSFDIVNNSDIISSQDFSEAMGHLIFYCQGVLGIKKSLGSHNNLEKVVGNYPCLYYTYLWFITSTMS